jgi:hypothetical protein
MTGWRKLLVSVVFAAVLPVAAFFVGQYSYSWGARGIQEFLWAPVQIANAGLESLCSSPGSGSFVCPYGQGAHNRLFFSSFFLVYFVLGIMMALAIFALRRPRDSTRLSRGL